MSICEEIGRLVWAYVPSVESPRHQPTLRSNPLNIFTHYKAIPDMMPSTLILLLNVLQTFTLKLQKRREGYKLVCLCCISFLMVPFSGFYALIISINVNKVEAKQANNFNDRKNIPTKLLYFIVIGVCYLLQLWPSIPEKVKRAAVKANRRLLRPIFSVNLQCN